MSPKVVVLTRGAGEQIKRGNVGDQLGNWRWNGMECGMIMSPLKMSSTRSKPKSKADKQQ